MTTMIRTTNAGFITCDKDKLAIYGMGTTEDEAFAEPAEFAGPFMDDDGVEIDTTDTEANLRAAKRDFLVYPATAALMQHVREHGGNIAWDISWDGVCGVDGEFDE